ncbi:MULTISPECIES: sodium-dependent transporter [Methanobrevibacter]|uniref:sodium-dependent transporter n=1 Tax=Methanobrevibacter TaxID=2172 RepID=UPI0015C1AC1D|nr:MULTISPECIES: sodium-dependent transporter [Methanobrevibacter]MBS7258243.1 sodium-dependent transporter [Methanobrevibacter sp.]MCI7428009.1 sodium-dependent transporter [Methanobrevibacter sp.]MDD6776346.1 sodium-dependent transporter [Methanobacteriaceae archaeon]MDY3096899.1 sodium-dependent transporter [Methanobrevibacter sp.]
MSEKKTVEWNSTFAFMMAMIGSAVGLGNIWRFPNVLYANGGGSFMIPYIVSLFLLGISFVLVEYAVGYRFKKSVGKILFEISKKLEPIAWFIVLVVFLITTYYVCVVGWDLIYVVLSFTKAWGADPNLFFSSNVLQATDALSGFFQIVPMVLASVFAVWLIIWLIVKRDLNDGIGNVSKILMPLLCLIVVFIVIFSLTLPGASVGYTQIFTPDWGALTNLDVWLAAFGQIVFSLSLGMAIAMTYASYLPDKSKLVDSAVTVAFSNSIFEVFNSIGIFSILGFMFVSTGIPFDELVTSGTGLAFVVFPQVLNTLGPMGYVIGPLFFLCILFAGITSAIALLEVATYAISEKFDIGRKKTVTMICVLGFIISIIFTTSLGSTILGAFDAFLNNFALLLGILIECIIFGWIYDFDKLISTLNKDSRIKVGKLWKIVIKFILPLCIAVLWIQGVYTTITTADQLSLFIMGILTVILIVLPIVFTKLPAKNEDYYKITSE